MTLDEIEATVARAKRRILTKGNKVEKALVESTEILLRTAPPKYSLWALFDDRGIAIAVMPDKPKDIANRRRGEWVKMVSEV